MAKKRRARAKPIVSRYQPYNPRLFTPSLVRALPRMVAPIKPLQVLEDRRTWHPERWNRPFAATKRSATRLVSLEAPKPLHAIGFREPSRVAICHRRKTRREVIFAKGSSGSGNRKPQRKPSSEISC